MSIIKFNFEKGSNIKISLPDNCQEEKIGENIGNSKNDFIPLKMLGESNFGTILVVKSKINKKNYIMKIIKKDPNDESHKIVEILILRQLNHPNIVKYYSSFEDNINYYIIIEYIIGPNLFDFYMSYKLKGKIIEEEVIWDFLGQCLEALTYLHGKAIIHRDIKLLNLLIDEKMQLKLIDFNCSAIMDKASAMNYINKNKISIIINKGTEINNNFEPPEMRTRNYNAKVDVYNTGKVFYELCNIYPNYYPYSNELTSLINEMMIEDPELRKTSDEIYILFKKQYTIYKYSSIFSCFHCLFNYPIWKESLKTQKKNMKNYITKFFIDSFFRKTSQNFEEYIKDFKKDKLSMLYDNNNKYKEKEPIFLIKYILSKLNDDLNKKGDVCVIMPTIIRDIMKQEEFLKYTKKYVNLFESIITQNFLGLLELKRRCQKCEKVNYFFNYFYYLSFDMEYLINNNIEINPKNLFNYLMKGIYRRLKCNSCNMEIEHKETIKLFDVPNNLILYFNWENNVFCYNNRNTIINFPEILILDDNYIEAFLDQNHQKIIYYYLNSILCKIYDNRGSYTYISLTREKFNENNIKNNNNNIKYFNLTEIKKKFTIIGLFYYSDRKVINNYNEDLPIYKINICKQDEKILYDIIRNNNNLNNNNNINNIGNINNNNYNYINNNNINNNNNNIISNNNYNPNQINDLKNNYFNNNISNNNYSNTRINDNKDLFNKNSSNIVYQQGIYNSVNEYINKGEINNNNGLNNQNNNNPNNNNPNNINYNNNQINEVNNNLNKNIQDNEYNYDKINRFMNPQKKNINIINYKVNTGGRNYMNNNNIQNMQNSNNEIKNSIINPIYKIIHPNMIPQNNNNMIPQNNNNMIYPNNNNTIPQNNNNMIPQNNSNMIPQNNNNMFYLNNNNLIYPNNNNMIYQNNNIRY